MSTTYTPPAAYTEAQARFEQTTADHQLTVLHDEGVYRHLRFKSPGTSSYWYELVTWPGVLTVRGDMGTFTFSREPDMIRDFFGRAKTINPDYWSEKIIATERHGGAKCYDRRVLERRLREHAEYHDDEADVVDVVSPLLTDPASVLPESGGESERHKYHLRVDEALRDHTDFIGDEHGARELLRELEHEGWVSDAWEWDLTEWTAQYLWCCWAIVKGIAAYDAWSIDRPADQCTHPNCEKHGKSPCEGIGCDGREKVAVNA
jgi:hypothetical protein